jgi:hypoxia up-regulated 1
MPKVKKLLEEYFKASKLELGQHLNGDEAMALGAAFRAANLSTAFRVRKVGMSDTSSFGVSVNLETLPKEAGFFSSVFSKLTGGEKNKEGSDEEAWKKHISLYPIKSPVPAKSKTLAFNYDKDILCRIEYDDDISLPEGTSKLLAVYNITGVADFAKETSSKGLGAPKVHLSFALDASGIVSLTKAEATLELPIEPEEKEEKEESSEAEEKSEEDKASGEEEAKAEQTESSDAEEKKADEASGETASSNTTETDSEKKEAKKDGKKEKSKKDSKKDAKKVTGLSLLYFFPTHFIEFPHYLG